MSIIKSAGHLHTNLGLSKFTPQGLDHVILLLDLSTAVLQLRLQQLRGLFVVGHAVMGFVLGFLKLLNLYTQDLKNRQKSFNMSKLTGFRTTYVDLVQNYQQCARVYDNRGAPNKH